MHNYPKNATFLYHNLQLHKMIKCKKIHTNGIFNVLIFINNHVNLYMNFMLSVIELFRQRNP